MTLKEIIKKGRDEIDIYKGPRDTMRLVMAGRWLYENGHDVLDAAERSLILEEQNKMMKEGFAELISNIKKQAPLGDCPIPLDQLDKARDILAKVGS